MPEPQPPPPGSAPPLAFPHPSLCNFFLKLNLHETGLPCNHPAENEKPLGVVEVYRMDFMNSSSPLPHPLSGSPSYLWSGSPNSAQQTNTAHPHEHPPILSLSRSSQSSLGGGEGFNLHLMTNPDSAPACSLNMLSIPQVLASLPAKRPAPPLQGELTTCALRAGPGIALLHPLN